MKEIKLRNGLATQVDDDDYDFLSQWTWGDFKGYVARRARVDGVGMTVFMHRIIMGLKRGDGIITDHIDNNPLNNQKSNLRKCTASENLKNKKGYGSSGYKGVYKRRHKATATTREYFYWISIIKVDGKMKHVGQFPYTSDGKILAAKAYDEAAKIHHGEFANLNFK